MPEEREFLVSTVDQMEALASPVRHQIHLAMEMLGRCSVNQLAERMDRVPETLYYHIRRLEKVGLVEQVANRIVSGREEAIYQLKAKRLRVDPGQTSPRFLRAMAKGCGSLLRFAQRSFEQALVRKAERRLIPNRSLRIEQVAVRLSTRKLAELNERLDSLQEFLIEADEPEVRQMFVVTISTAPL